jgi:hypothetical protein
MDDPKVRSIRGVPVITDAGSDGFHERPSS